MATEGSHPLVALRCLEVLQFSVLSLSPFLSLFPFFFDKASAAAASVSISFCYDFISMLSEGTMLILRWL